MLWNVLIFGHDCKDVTEEYEKPESAVSYYVQQIESIYSCSIQTNKPFTFKDDGFQFADEVFDKDTVEDLKRIGGTTYYNNDENLIEYTRKLESFVKSKFEMDVFCYKATSFQISKDTTSKMHKDKQQSLGIYHIPALFPKVYHSPDDYSSLRGYFATLHDTITFWINLEDELKDHPLAMVSQKEGLANKAYILDPMVKGNTIIFGGDTTHGALKRNPTTDFSRKSVAFTCIEAKEVITIIRKYRSTEPVHKLSN
eukprot:NODE_525_length_6489_cov_0.356338.p4 type:complete len:255 gc:universal NODE_525_length_6489_cov_0.356338:988-224(-)